MKPHKQPRSVKFSTRSQVPYGYRKEGQRLVTDHQEAAIVRQIFEEYIAANGVITDSILESMQDLHTCRVGQVHPWRRLA